VTIGFVDVLPVRTVARVVFMRAGEIIPPQQLVHLAGDLLVEFADDAVLEGARMFPQITTALTALNIHFARLELSGPAEAVGQGSRGERLKSVRASAWRPFLPPASGTTSNASLSAQSNLLTTPSRVDEAIILHISVIG